MKFVLRIFTLSFFLLLAFTQVALAQTTIRGTVIDEGNGEPLFSATVQIKGTSVGAVTDFDGLFSIETDMKAPYTLVISMVGYSTKEEIVNDPKQKLLIKIGENSTILNTVEIVGQRVSDKQKAAPLTVENMDVLAIKQAPALSFYESLGSMKGVDQTSASLGFTIINTRGFNSTSPVRSLQVIDGVDNQAPGLNFSLGNFLGTSELDVLKVDLVVGAASAFYGPNAFNGVISMETKNPFYQKGLGVSLKGGERSLFEGAIRYADALKNKDGNDFMAYKMNFFFLKAYDWEADNYDPISGGKTKPNNPGRWDAVNIYGDEYSRNMDFSKSALWDYRGMGEFHRTGYKESDLVDYNTKNVKANAALHFRTIPSQKDASPELILSSNFGSGTTVYQGDNRFSLRNILFFQNRVEFRKRDKYFFRAYTTRDDAGDSYDPYFTALLLQQEAKNTTDYGIDYSNWWKANIDPRMLLQGYPKEQIVFPPNGGLPMLGIDSLAAVNWIANNQDSLTIWHQWAAAYADTVSSGFSQPFFDPDTQRFQEAFDRITKGTSKDLPRGTRFVDRSALYHGHGEYKFEPTFCDYITVGANTRLYTPISEGSIFYDTAGTKITNFEYGAYAGIQKKFGKEKFTANATIRMDKNQNFDFLFSPAASVVWKPKDNNYLRLSFSSAIRNPTLTDQYLFLNVGRATLAGNLQGVDSLITVESFVDYLNARNFDLGKLAYFNIDPIRPERVKSVELGYRTTISNNFYIDGSYYFSYYSDFIGYQIGIRSTFDEFGFPYLPQAFRYAANAKTNVTTQGFSIGANYYFKKLYMLTGNYSWNRLNKTTADDPIIPAFNTPEHKFNVGVSGRDIIIGKVKNIGFNVNYKWINGFIFEGSPQFTGYIPTYDLVDAQVNWRYEKINTTFKLGASNLLNKKRFQTYGGPRIGRMAYLAAIYDFVKK